MRLYSFSKVFAHLFCFDSIELSLSARKNAIVFENQYIFFLCKAEWESKNDVIFIKPDQMPEQCTVLSWYPLYFFIHCSSLGHSGKISTSVFIKKRILDAADIFSFTLVFNAYGVKAAGLSGADGRPSSRGNDFDKRSRSQIWIIDSFKCRDLHPLSLTGETVK